MRLTALPVLACLAMTPMALPASATTPVRCHVVTDPAGDAVHQIGSSGMTTPNIPALDVLSADVGIGAKTLVFVVRVAGLGDVLEQGPQTYQWQMYFTLRGGSFAANATRAPDGTRFYVSGDLQETQAVVPGTTTPTVLVTGSFDPAKNEIRVVVPRKYLPHTRPTKDSLTNLTVDSFDGVGLLSADGASSGLGMDRTNQPGARLPLNARTCVPAS